MLFHMKHRAPPALKLIVLSVLVVAANACGGSVAPATPTEHVGTDQAAITLPGPGPQIIDVASGLVIAVTPAAGGTIPFGQTPQWTTSSSLSGVGQFWTLKSSPGGVYSNRQRICSQQDPTTCLKYDASGNLTTQSFANASLFDIGTAGGLWMTADHSRQITPPTGAGPVHMGAPNTNSQSILWLSNTNFFVQSQVTAGYWTVDGSLNVLPQPPAGAFAGGLTQPGVSQEFTSAFLGVGANGFSFPTFSYASTLASGQTLAFLPKHGLQPLLGHQAGRTANTLIAAYGLNKPSIGLGVVLDDSQNNCALSSFNGGNVYAHDCGDSSASGEVYNVRWL